MAASSNAFAPGSDCAGAGDAKPPPGPVPWPPLSGAGMGALANYLPFPIPPLLCMSPFILPFFLPPFFIGDLLF